jgi:hypothetical protein
MSRPLSITPRLAAYIRCGDRSLSASPVEREREVAERIGGVRGPVVHRARPQRLQLVVVLGAVELERVDAARAFFGIEPAFRQKHAHRVDAVLEPMQRGEL